MSEKDETVADFTKRIKQGYAGATNILWYKRNMYSAIVFLEQLKAEKDDLLKACQAWEKVESEMSENTPCPDLALRASYRKEAVRLTTAALAKAQPSKVEQER